MSDHDKIFGLESIILHHSFDQVKGRTIRIECRERTHLGGVNGAGKTSVLSLVPAFFGEEPERIVTKASGKLSFLDYYLPTFQSLIIFEYRRYSGLCCAVMFRHSQGKPCYRFVNGSAEETFFAPEIRTLMQSGASADDIFAGLRQQGVTVSKIIDTITNYRAIIQRNQKLLKRLPADARWLRALSADFGLGNRDTQMSHIERLTHVVLNKNRLLSSFKTMICETQFENIHQHSRPRAIDRKDLIADIRSLAAFAREEDKIRDCLRKDAERLAILQQTDKTVANLKASVEEAHEKRAELTRERDRLDEERQNLREAFAQTDSEFSRRIVGKKHEFSKLDSQLTELHHQNEQYETAGVPAKVQDFSNLADYRQRLATARADHEQLTGKVSRLEGEFERDRAEAEREFDKLQGQRRDKRASAEEVLRNARHQHEQKLKAVEIEQANAISRYKEARASERVALSSDEARLMALRDNPSQTPDERQQITEAEAAVAVADEQVATVNENRLEAVKKRDQAERDWKVAQDQVATMDETVQRLEQEFDVLQRQIAPEDGSWLSQLRSQDPAWGTTIARVIDPALLHRKDLAPVFSSRDATGGQRHTVMGWSLQIGELPIPEFAASEEELQARGRALDERRQQVWKQRTETERDARRRQEAYKSRSDALDRLETEFTIIKRTLDNARTRLESTKARLAETLSRRVAEFAREYEATRSKLQAFDEETAAGITAVEAQFQQQLMDLRAHWSEKEADLQGDIDKISEMMASALQEHKSRLQQKQQVHDQRLAEDGIDPKVVQQSRTQLEALQATVDAVVASEDLVREYQAWRKREWAGVESLTEQANAAESGLATLTRQREAGEAAYKEQDVKLKAVVEEHRGAIKQLKERIEAAEGVLRHFGGIAGIAGEMTGEGFPGNLEDLTRELQSAHQKLDQLRREVVATFDRAAAVLNQYHNTQIHKSWQKLSAYRRDRFADEVFEHDEAFKLARVPDLRELLDTDIPQLRHALVDQFMSEAGSLVKYFEGLEVMASEVKSVSSLLKRKINTDQQIDSLSDIRVVLHPRIYEDETWQPLKEFVDAWHDWGQLHKRDLPSEALLRRFQLVTDTLSDARVKDSIESMVDMHLEMMENGRKVVIRTDADFLSASSTGLTYLAIMAVFMGLTRYLCPDLSTRITWPIDELGTLSDNNIARLAEMLEHNNLTMISACPKLDRALRRFFENKISLKNGRVHTYESARATTTRSNLFAGLSSDRAVTAGEATDVE